MSAERLFDVVSFETRREASTLRLGGGLEVANVAAGLKWQGPLTKNIALFSYLQDKLKRGRPNDLVLVVKHG